MPGSVMMISSGRRSNVLSKPQKPQGLRTWNAPRFINSRSFHRTSATLSALPLWATSLSRRRMCRSQSLRSKRFRRSRVSLLSAKRRRLLLWDSRRRKRSQSSSSTRWRNPSKILHHHSPILTKTGILPHRAKPKRPRRQAFRNLVSER